MAVEHDMSDGLLSPGTVVADTYDVERLIGRGAMGEVYAAKHRRLPGLSVAIKVLTGPSQGGDRLARFRREAEIAAKLSHPNIVQVIDYQTLPTGQPYLVMELLRGESLHARLKRGPLDLKTLQRIVREVGAALDAAHQAGVVHRDLKPENIFLVPTPTGDQAKVLDFGISKWADGAPVHTTDSMIIGTPRYMSPEQAMGLNSQLTARSDIFAFATVCYEALTGKPIYESENVAQLLYQIAQVPHPPVRSVLPDVPVTVARALEHALVKDPEKRTPDVLTFVREFSGSVLAPNLSGLNPVLTTPTAGPTQQPTRDDSAPAPASVPEAEPRPRGWVVPVALAVVVVSVGGVLVMAKLSQSLDDRAPQRVALPPVDSVVAAAEPVKRPEVKGEAVATAEGAGAEPTAQADDDVVVDADAGEVVKPSEGSTRVKEPVRVPATAAKPRPKFVEVPVTDDERPLLAKLTDLTEEQAWGPVLLMYKQVLALPRTSAARRQGLLMVLEAACARRETNVSAIFNLLIVDHPELWNQAVDLCHRHQPDQDFERPR